MLTGSYQVNEKIKISNYYLRQFSSDTSDPKYLIDVKKNQKYKNWMVKKNKDYKKIIVINNRNETTIEVFENTDSNIVPVVYNAEDFDNAYEDLDKDIENLGFQF